MLASTEDERIERQRLTKRRSEPQFSREKVFVEFFYFVFASADRFKGRVSWRLASGKLISLKEPPEGISDRFRYKVLALGVFRPASKYEQAFGSPLL